MIMFEREQSTAFYCFRDLCTDRDSGGRSPSGSTAGTVVAGSASYFLPFITTQAVRTVHALIRRLVDYFRIPPDRHQYFDENVAADQWDLLEAAALLQITEFKVFELAYKEWYGVVPKPRVIEVHFRNYMFNQLIPGWVANFCRRVVEMEQAGTLEPRDFGIYQRLPSRRMRLIGKAYAAMLLVGFLLVVYLAYGQEVAGLLADRDGSRAADTIGLPQHNTIP